MDKKLECPAKEIKCKMPYGKLSYGKDCNNCQHGQYDSRKEQVWCGYWNKWYPSGDKACDHWLER